MIIATAARATRVLIVDDTAAGRATMEGALLREGHELHFADSGPTCLAMAAAIMPDLILLDVMMPGMDGFEVCQRLRADATLRHIPIALVTALADADAMAQGLSAGADDFLGKPFNKWELRARVSTLIRLGVQQRALAARDRLLWVAEHADEGFLLLDRARQVTHCNAMARRFLGVEMGAEVQGDFLTLATRHAEPYPAAAWEQWDTATAGDAPLYLVRDVPRGLRKEWWQVIPHRDPLDPDDITVVSLRDVTAQVERQMRQFEFHELVSHKLRTPLNGVVGAVDLLSRDASTLSARHQRLLEVLRTSTDRLNGAILDVLGFVDGGAERESPMAVRQLEPLVRGVATEQRIANLRVTIDDTVRGAHIGMGEVAMRTVLRELLENARRFHPAEQPVVGVRIAADETSRVRVTVEDDGVCLTPTQLLHVLEPYVQGDHELTGQMPGMGIGLALVSTRVRAAGGRCTIENRTDHAGIRVNLLLPRTDL